MHVIIWEITKPLVGERKKNNNNNMQNTDLNGDKCSKECNTCRR
jgi:hypothetical protein